MFNDIELKNKILFDPEVCVKCGYCKSNCPTYLAKLDERVSPRGRLVLSRKIYSGDLGIQDLFNFYSDLDTCSKCVECERACPVGLKPWLNFVLVKNHTVFGKFESLFAKLISKNEIFFKLAFSSFMNIRRYRNDQKDQGGKFESKSINSSQINDYVFVFPTCFGYTFFKNTIDKLGIILKSFGVSSSVVPKDFACCGAPIFLSGDLKSFRNHARRFSESVKKEIVDKKSGKILVFGSTCAWVMKEIFPVEAGVSISDVYEVSDYVVGLLSKQSIRQKVEPKFVSKKSRDFLLHKPCHRESSLDGFFLSFGLNFENTDFSCCGFGGSLMFKHWNMSDSLLLKTLENKKGSIVVSTSPGCIINISRKKKALHLVDFIYDILFD
ncbi:MAG: (Fe-S)-binding protein [Candidatus Calescibacterium sp.]|nr:(Fe-S)-binding protein [Candidatus Calescibacterium sp.]MDW8087025.1 (Fe-S)-binding protein [Candidatus Calescibacterium sp.]